MSTLRWINYKRERVSMTNILDPNSDYLKTFKCPENDGSHRLFLLLPSNPNFNEIFFSSQSALEMFKNKIVSISENEMIENSNPEFKLIDNMIRCRSDDAVKSATMHYDSCIPAYILFPNQFDPIYAHVTLNYGYENLELYLNYELLCSLYMNLIEIGVQPSPFVYSGPDIQGEEITFSLREAPKFYKIRFENSNDISNQYGPEFINHLEEHGFILKS